MADNLKTQEKRFKESGALRHKLSNVRASAAPLFLAKPQLSVFCLLIALFVVIVVLARMVLSLDALFCKC